MFTKNNIMLLGLAIAATCLAVSMSAAAKSSATLSQAKADMIVQNCTQIQSTLSSIHSSDALLRVNRGQTYELISSRLMSPLNTRIAANKLDGASLIEITSDYSSDVSNFRTAYINYERQMTKTIRTNCHKSAEKFYDNLVKTRELREEVHTYVADINREIHEYKKAFDSFKQTVTNKDAEQ